MPTRSLSKTRQSSFRISPSHISELIKVSLGDMPADLAILNGSFLNVYTKDISENGVILIKHNKIAYVGPKVSNGIGQNTQLIDAKGKLLIPGLIDGHTHVDWPYCARELVKSAIKGGTTTIITEASDIAFPMGYKAVREFLNSIKHQPIKIFLMSPAMVSISKIAEKHAINVRELRRLFREKEVLGLGESFWAQVLDGKTRVIKLIAETLNARKILDGHTAGARGNKLQAYISAGISSCHEPTNVADAIERLRLGLTVLIREGEVRRDLRKMVAITRNGICTRQLGIATDGIAPKKLASEGYMNSILQEAIKTGMDPILAVQMMTSNVAAHFGIDGQIGGIAPGKYADILILPSITDITSEYVISNGEIVAERGELKVALREQKYARFMRKSVRLRKVFTKDNFVAHVTMKSSTVKVRVIELVGDLITREAFATLPVSNGKVVIDVDQDLLKIAAVDRYWSPGKTFTGYIKGFGLKMGAIGTSVAWGTGNIVVVGADESDMAECVNRIKILQGGIVLSCDGHILAEVPLPLGGIFSEETMERLAVRLQNIQKAASDLGCTVADVRITLAILSAASVPQLRICAEGLFNVKERKTVPLILTGKTQ